MLAPALAALTLATSCTAEERPWLSLVQGSLQIHSRRSETKAWPNPATPGLQPTPEQIFALSSLRNHIDDVRMVNRTLAAVAIMPVWYVVQESGYGLIFQALEDFPDPTVQMQALRGLSDQSHTLVGGKIIADWGGRNEGIRYLLKLLQAHTRPYEAECADHLTYQYEGLQVLSGLLRHDTSCERVPIAVEAGLLNQIAHTMRVEADRRASQDASCIILSVILHNCPRFTADARELGFDGLVRQALERHGGEDNTPFWFNVTVGQSFQVAKTCGLATALLGRSGR